ncbi:acyloxyacyl hydrolase [Hyphomonas sp.]|uniref:acyloxyacyl hydrolase n=1 Tax=Hyphomonas sp. TaxID=87 RepID=UPI00391CD2A6
MRRTALVLSLTFAPALVAQAGPVDEIRLGVIAHNVCIANCDNANKEDGPNINGEIVFDSPEFLSILWSPRPYVMGSLNTAGDTNFGGVGLQWDWEFAEGWAIEPGVGYAIHDGELTFPYPQGDPRNDPISATAVFFGSRDLFRTSLSLNKDLGEKWGVQLMYEHLSHGQILGSGRNQGLDNIGVRVRYRFGD